MQVISERTRKIRKTHHCWGCTREYPIGTDMNYVVSVDGRRICGVYWCDICDKFMQDNWREMDLDYGFDYGDFLEYDNYSDANNIKITNNNKRNVKW